MGTRSDLKKKIVYGLVNASFVEFLGTLGEGGDRAVEVLERDSVIPTGGFATFQAYPDEVTYTLVGTASEAMGKDAAEILRKFGIYWVLETAPTAFPELMALAGSEIHTFLSSLNTLHDRGHAIFPEYKPPSFRIEGHLDEDEHLRVFYSSTREGGLEPFLIGLLEGVGRRFDMDLSVTIVGKCDTGELELRVKRKT